MMRLTGLITALCLVAFASGAKAEPVIDITNGHPTPMPIAIPDFYAAAPADAQIGANVASVVSADLERSGLFAPIDKQAFIQDNASLQTGVRYQDWKQINAQTLVSGSARSTGNGQVNVQFRLFDVFGGQQMVGFQYTAGTATWRRVAHKIADEIYKRITGEEGYFDTRIVYISETGPKDHRQKRLAIMDQDGENHKFLTDGSVLVLTPRFNPSAQEITYMSYYANRPRVYLFKIDSGEQELLGDFPGMTFAPRFSPDGSKVIMSMAQGGNTDIYVMDLATRRSHRITSDLSIDTSPCYSPDGSKVVFNSDRSGEQQLYTMSADGSNVQRISKGQGRYATPVWSPRGDLIAFTKMAGGQFQIGVMRPDGTGERILTTAWLVEGPTWAPNGRVLAFFSQDQRGLTQLHSIDLTGNNERIMKTPMDGSDPAWSPLLDNQ